MPNPPPRPPRPWISTTAPRRGVAPIILAIEHYKKQEYAEAWKYLDKTPGQNINSFALPLLRAWGMAPTQPAEAALNELALLKNFQDTSDLVDVMSGLLNEFYGRKEAALVHYDQLAAHIENERFSILRLVAEGYHRLGKGAQVPDLITKYLSTHTASPALESYVAGFAKAGNEKVTAASGMSEALFASAELLLMSDANEPRAQVATAYAQIALYLNPELTIARRFIGSTLAARGRYDESSAVLAGIKRSDPGFIEVQMQVAENLLRQKRNADALTALRAVIKDRPTWPEAHVAVGDILRQEKKYPDAIVAYDSAIKAAPPAKPENWVIYYTRGIAHERNKNWDMAEKDFRTALDLKPNEPSVLNYLGYSYLDRGEKLDEALSLIESAYRQRPNDGYIIDSMGWAQYMTGDYEKAVVSLEKAVESAPSDGTINEHLGDVYWKVGRRNEARFQWQRALSLDIEEPQRAAIRVKLERGLAQK
jgi:tetratricopeptide (TPR) repeat protein